MVKLVAAAKNTYFIRFSNLSAGVYPDGEMINFYIGLR